MISDLPPAHLLRGPFNFLRPTEEEIRSLFPQGDRILASPYPIFLADETATPLSGFPVELSDGLLALKDSMEAYLAAEEAVQVAVYLRQPFDRSSYTATWNRYKGLLATAVEHATVSSYGRRYPEIFWLAHSLDIARWLKETPKRTLRRDLEIGRKYGDQVKYRVFEKALDNLLTTTYDTVHRLAQDTEELEQELFPRLLSQMCDNVLIFTEDHVSSDLAELGSYFNGSLRIDGRSLRQRFGSLVEWHQEQLAEDRQLVAAVRHLVGDEELLAEPRQLLNVRGYVSFLAHHRRYDQKRLLSPEQVKIWESLLVKLKEFEVFSGLRRLVLPVRQENGEIVFRAGGLDRTWIGQRQLELSAATRPLDFLAPWVTDPLVQRFGIIYDISNFSAVISMLRRAGTETQEQAFRQMFRFQRRVNKLATSYRMQLEKYLGDGAFFTSRHPIPLLLCAVHLQRLYGKALSEGLPFDRGMRIGLNLGTYRLIPLETGDGGHRYEFFGHGVVELSRLTAGKGQQEIEEVQNMLINHGYPRQTVLRFFEPLSDQNLDLVDQETETRPHYAYINRNGNLVNEGVVATASFIDELDKELPEDQPMLLSCQGDRCYAVLTLEDRGGRTSVGLRKLGMAHLKGLDDLAIYEIVDGDELTETAPMPKDPEEQAEDSRPPSGGILRRTLERMFANRYAQRGAAE